MATDPMQNLIFVLILLQFKHFVCDGPLQTAAMVRDKGHYGRFLGIVHSGAHGLSTGLVLLVAGLAIPPLSFGVAALLAILDFVIHYHVDFSKEQIVRRAGWTTAVPQFWWALSADQSLHQLTYLLIGWFAVTAV